MTPLAHIRTAVASDAAELAALRWQSRSDEEKGQERFPAFERRFDAWLRGALASGALDLLVRDAEGIGLVELHVWPSQRAIAFYVRAGFRSPEHQRAGDDPDEPSYVLPLEGTLRQAPGQW